MKTFTLVLAFLLIAHVPFSSTAQVAPHQPSVALKNLPLRLVTPLPQIQTALLKVAGANCKIEMSQGFVLEGKVLSAVTKFGKLSVVTIALSSIDDAVLSLSKTKNDDNSYTYSGHLINKDYSEGYRLKKNIDGTYAFEKLNMNDLVQDR